MRRVLVANRGEIARRVFRTARAMGLQTVAIYSVPDADAPFVREADLAVPLGGSTSAESYLDVERVLAAARAAGADAVHPGYGFLSENPAFAEAVEAAGLMWIGPTPHSIRAMALKVEAKRLAAEAGLPLVPGAELPDDASAEQIRSVGDEVGFPLLVKASAGGGGKGMRIVDDPADLVDAVAAASREATSAFGDGTVFLERFLFATRHVEVQVFGDSHGRVVHLFERECSIQRRHQKIVEESPAPGLTPLTAERMYMAAASLARAIGYVGAGTVEFLVAETPTGQEFFFLEMNTRLQVEHAVTEAITGLDLVEWQIRVARGEMLPLSQGEIARRGHAIEVRLYAEDPARGYLPNTGTLERFTMPGDLRVDSGVESGSVVTPYYDPMLAKVIAHAPDRVTATQVLSRGLRASRIHGLVTNRDSLVAILESEAFRGGETTTAFLETHPVVLAPQTPPDIVDRHLVVLALASVGQPGTGPDGVPAGWRNVPAVPELVGVERITTEATLTLAVGYGRTGPSVVIHDGDPHTSPGREIGPLDIGPHGMVLDGLLAGCEVSRYGDLACVDDGLWSTQWRVLPRFRDVDAEAGARGPSTPVPGTVTMVEVAAGDVVREGQVLVVLEAMKMEHRITADADARVAEVLVSPGDSVDAHAVVVVLEALAGEAESS